LGPLDTAATNRPIVSAPGDYDDGEIGGMIGRGNRTTRRKPSPSAALSTTNPTCCPDANPGRRGGKPATNRLSYGTAFHVRSYCSCYREAALFRFIFSPHDRLRMWSCGCGTDVRKNGTVRDHVLFCGPRGL
jgi:hypothetical protein